MILVSSDLEKSFLEGLLHHDEAIMRAFYSTYYRYLAATVMLYVPRQQDMQDVLQDIFIKIFTKINRFTYKGHGSLQAWIHKIAVNESLKFVQSRKRRFHYPIDQYDKEEDGENDPEQFTIDDIPQQVLLEMIRTLPERYRLVFNLFVFEEKGRDLEERRLFRFEEALPAVEESLDTFFGNHPETVAFDDFHPFTKVHQMGRRIESDFQPAGGQAGSQHVAGRALAVGPGDMDTAEAPVRMPERFVKRRHRLNPRLIRHLPYLLVRRELIE